MSVVFLPGPYLWLLVLAPSGAANGSRIRITREDYNAYRRVYWHTTGGDGRRPDAVCVSLETNIEAGRFCRREGPRFCWVTR